jgi:hypothetical protein
LWIGLGRKLTRGTRDGNDPGIEYSDLIFDNFHAGFDVSHSYHGQNYILLCLVEIATEAIVVNTRTRYGYFLSRQGVAAGRVDANIVTVVDIKRLESLKHLTTQELRTQMDHGTDDSEMLG